MSTQLANVCHVPMTVTTGYANGCAGSTVCVTSTDGHTARSRDKVQVDMVGEMLSTIHARHPKPPRIQIQLPQPRSIRACSCRKKSRREGREAGKQEAVPSEAGPRERKGGRRERDHPRASMVHKGGKITMPSAQRCAK